MSQWYYVDNNGQQAGPVQTSQISDGLANGTIPATTKLWTEGLPDWQAVSEVPQFSIQLSGAATPAPSPYNSPAVDPTTARQARGPKPQTWLWQSIVVTLLCCWPLGIPAIVYAAKVDAHWNAGRQAEAIQASAQAKMWTMISGISGAVVLVIYFIVLASQGGF